MIDDKEQIDPLPPTWTGEDDESQKKTSENTDANGNRFMKLPIVLVLAIIIGVVAIGSILYLDLFTHPNEEVPLVEASKTPIKERPTSPGGMKIPNQDKLVYNRVGNNREEPKTERLLPPPEEPQRPPSQILTPSATSVPTKRQSSSRTNGIKTSSRNRLMSSRIENHKRGSKVERLLPPPEKTRRLKSKKPIALPSLPEQGVAFPLPIPKSELTSQQVASVPVDAYLIQVAAFREKSKAQDAWKQISEKHKDILGNLNSYIVAANLGSKGIFYRVRSGPFSSRAAAEDVCTKLRLKKVSCFAIASQN